MVRASCPAPAGFGEFRSSLHGAVFELGDGSTLTRVVGGSCKAVR